MKLALCLFNYFPFGGLQRDFLRIAKMCMARGHDIHVYTMQWEGEVEVGFKLHLVKVKAWQNYQRGFKFAQAVKADINTEQYDLVIGFNKMPHLDVYYAADVCFKERLLQKHPSFYQYLPRNRHYANFEKAVFASDLKTQVMLIAPKQQSIFQKHYQTASERFHLLPPGIAKDRRAPSNASELRIEKRCELGVSQDELLLLMVGSGFKTKGVDRAITALSTLPALLKQCVKLFVIGQDDPQPFMKLAKILQVDNQVKFLGGRNDVSTLLLAADLLLHPAYHENTGTVLLEALVSGLPILTVEACGYAHYVSKAGAGEVLAAPFEQVKFNQALEKMLLAERTLWQRNALAFAETEDLYSMPEKAADLIERIGNRYEN